MTWTHNLGASATFKVNVSRNQGSTWTEVASSVPSSGDGNGTYSWLVTGPATIKGRVQVVWNANTGVNDRDSVNFTIQ